MGTAEPTVLLQQVSDEEKEDMAAAFTKGVKEGRSRILSKMAPRRLGAKRSRTLKTGVMAAGGGQAAWDMLKRRAHLLRKQV